MPVPDCPIPAPAMAAGRHPPPWYREPWPWLLFFPPAVAVVAGLVTMAIAIDSFDGVVSDDYYRQGLAINRSIDREAQARARGLSARLQFNPSGARVRVAVSGDVSADGVRAAAMTSRSNWLRWHPACMRAGCCVRCAGAGTCTWKMPGTSGASRPLHRCLPSERSAWNRRH